MIQVAGTHHGHRSGQLAQWSAQASGNQPGAKQPTDQRKDESEQENSILIGEDVLQPGIRSPDAGLPRLPVDLPIQLGERRKQPALELPLCNIEGSLMLASIVQPEDAVCRYQNLPLNLANARVQLLLVRM